VTQVDYFVREGNVRRQLRQFAMESHADIMVMGRPTRSPGRNLFKAAEFEAFVAELEREGNLHGVQVTPSQDAERTDL
jgi:K+-sensing histidine kinase KdpD